MAVTSLNADWKPIIRVSERIPSASFLSDANFLGEYNAKVDESFNGNKALKVLRQNGGSNPFAVSLVGEMIMPLGYSGDSQRLRILVSEPVCAHYTQ